MPSSAHPSDLPTSGLPSLRAASHLSAARELSRLARVRQRSTLIPVVERWLTREEQTASRLRLALAQARATALCPESSDTEVDAHMTALALLRVAWSRRVECLSQRRALLATVADSIGAGAARWALDAVTSANRRARYDALDAARVATGAARADSGLRYDRRTGAPLATHVRGAGAAVYVDPVIDSARGAAGAVDRSRSLARPDSAAAVARDKRCHDSMAQLSLRAFLAGARSVADYVRPTSRKRNRRSSRGRRKRSRGYI